MLHPEALSFTSNAYGYMLAYRGQNIGGAGNAHRNPKHWQNARKDRAMFADGARREIEALKAGRGSATMKSAISQIDGKP